MKGAMIGHRPGSGPGQFASPSSLEGPHDHLRPEVSG